MKIDKPIDYCPGCTLPKPVDEDPCRACGLSRAEHEMLRGSISSAGGKWTPWRCDAFGVSIGASRDGSRVVCLVLRDVKRRLCDVEVTISAARTLRNQLAGLLNSVEGRARRPVANAIDVDASGSVVGTYFPSGGVRRDYEPVVRKSRKTPDSTT